MTTDTTQLSPITPETPFPFGLRLQSAREALGLEAKDAAQQLRLNEQVILMLERDCFASDLPATFIRGYIRAYGKLLQIPEDEIKQAIAPIKLQTNSAPLTTSKIDDAPKVTSSHYFMQLSTYLVVFTVLSLVGIWWYNHSSSPTALSSEHQLALPPEASNQELTPGMTIKSDATAGTLTLGAKVATPPTPEEALAPPTPPVVATNTLKPLPAAVPVKIPATTTKKPQSSADDDEDDEESSD